MKKKTILKIIFIVFITLTISTIMPISVKATIGNSLFNQMATYVASNNQKAVDDRFIALNGGTTHTILSSIPSKLDNDYDIAICEFGTNEYVSMLNDVPVNYSTWELWSEETYIKHYTALINTLKNKGVKQFYILSAPPVDGSKCQGELIPYSNITQSRTDEINEWNKKVANANDCVEYLDFKDWFDTNLTGNWTIDGVHMNIYGKYYGNWYNTIRTKVKDLAENPQPVSPSTPPSTISTPKPTSSTPPSTISTPTWQDPNTLFTDIIENPNSYIQNVGDNSGAKDIGNIIVSLIKTIGQSISVIMLMIIGIKYILGSVEEKAEYKKTIWIYILGAALIFLGSSLTNIIYKALN